MTSDHKALSERIEGYGLRVSVLRVRGYVKRKGFTYGLICHGTHIDPRTGTREHRHYEIWRKEKWTQQEVARMHMRFRRQVPRTRTAVFILKSEKLLLIRESKLARFIGLFIPVRGHLEPRKSDSTARRVWRRNLKLETFRHYSGQWTPCCKVCGFNNMDALDLHPFGPHVYHMTGHELYVRLKGMSYPPGYEVLCSNCNNKRAGRGLPSDLKLRILRAYSPEMKCVGCGVEDPWMLTLDHLEGKGREHVRSLVASGEIETEGSWYKWIEAQGYPAGYQVLCWNCQRIKQVKNQEYASRVHDLDLPKIDPRIFAEQAESTSKLTTVGWPEH